MKKILLLILVAWTNYALATTYYVGGAGASDSNPGTQAAPFLTITKAAQTAISGDVVMIRAGTYRETITPTNSGVTFQSSEGAIVSGLNPVPGPWVLDAGNVYKTTISLGAMYTEQMTGFSEDNLQYNNTQMLAQQIFDDGEMAMLASYPKVAKADSLLKRSSFRTLNQATITGTSITDAGLSPYSGTLGGAIMTAQGWFIIKTKTVTNSGTTLSWTGDIPSAFRKFYRVVGARSLLTQAGEWYYNGSNTLYFWQKDNASPTGVEYKARNWGFDLRNKSGTTIIGISFIGCDPVMSNSSSTNTTIDNVRAKYTSHHVVMSRTGDGGAGYQDANVQTGTKLLGAGSILKNSEFNYASGVTVWAGSGVTIQNNKFENGDYGGSYGAFIKLYYNGTSGTSDVKIVNNTFTKSGRGAIELTGVSNNIVHTNLEIAYNDFSKWEMINLDGGAIYASRKTILTGSRVHHNWFHNDKGFDEGGTGQQDGIHVNGVYFDQASGPVTLDHNVHWNGQSGANRTGAYAADFYTQTWWQENGVYANGVNSIYNNTFATSTGGGQYSYVTHQDTNDDIQRNNIYAAEVDVNWGDFYGGPNFKGDVANSIKTGTNPQYLQTGSGGLYYRLSAASAAAINQGTNAIGSPYTDGSVGTIDIGAYEYGGNAWTAGYTATAGQVIVPTPPANAAVVMLHLNEAAGMNPVDDGSSQSSFTRSVTTPVSTMNSPAGVGGANAFDFGVSNGNYYVESSSAINGLKSLSAFTLTGWLNCKSSTVGAGGNRIISWINGSGDGVDLVYKSDGSLQLGIDEAPTASPALSSANKVTTNVSAPSGNWVFFAVTYQSSTGQVQFYFGNNSTDASLDATKTYSTPGVTGANIGKLAIGHYNDVSRAAATDRMFKGIIDDIQIYNYVLTQANILSVQKATTDSSPPTVPTGLTSTAKTDVTVDLTWTASSDNVGVTGYEVFHDGNLAATFTSPTGQISGLTANTTYSFAVRAKDAVGNYSAFSTALPVTTNSSASPTIHIEAESYSSMSGVTNGGTDVESTDGGDWMKYSAVNLGTGYTTLKVRYAKGAGGTGNTMTIRTGSTSGPIIGTLTTADTGGWGTFVTTNVTLSGGTGVQDMYMVFSSGTGIGNFDWFELSGGPLHLEAESYTAMSGISLQPTTVESTDGGDWIKFDNVNLGTGFTTISTRYAKGNAGNGTVNVRLGSTTGTIIATITTPSTGGWATFSTANAPITGGSGIQTLYFVWPSGSGNGNFDYFDLSGSDLTAPSTPTTLASPSKTGNTVNLTWTASTDNVAVTGYDIYRAGTILAGSSNTNSATITGLLPGTLYSFTVKAKDGSGNVSPASSAYNVTTNPLPDPWASVDIGSPGIAGSASWSAGTFTLNGTGLDTWGTADQFYYVYRSMSGDGEIVARVVSVSNTNSNAKAGVMIRESLSADSKHAMMNITPGGEHQFIWRSATTGSTNYALVTGAVAPYWVKMKRSGATFSAWESSNGTSWTQIGVNQTISMGTTVYYGLSVVAKTNSTLNTSSFDNVVLKDGSGNVQARMALAEVLEEHQAINADNPDVAKLYQNYPNPFTDKTEITMYIPSSSVTAGLQFIDPIGISAKEISIADRGQVSVLISSADLKPGVYLYYLRINGRIVGIKRMISVK